MSVKLIDLCDSLMRADSALDVKTILSRASFWEDESAWRPFADNENNFGSIGNQQSDAVAALVEKLINCIDARLMGLAAVHDVTLQSPNCPQDMKQAIAYFIEGKVPPFGDMHGSIFYWTDSQIKKESELISLFATGKKATEGFPCLTISDSGEGQTPDRFPDTFMSLGKQNKMRIPFVQGKFNMGGTGAFQFCSGEDKTQVQLVISRRDPRLLDFNKTTRDDEWGFTIVRRVTRTGMRNPMYEYLAPVDGQVLSFVANSLPIFPSDDKDRPVPYRKHAEYGTLVKLYEYTCKFAKTNIIFAGSSGDSLKTRIEEALPEAALPIQIAECRPHFSGKHRSSFVEEILGTVTQLGSLDREGRNKRLETLNPITGIVTLEGSRLPVRAFVFKEDPGSNRYNSKGVLLTINGQTHGTLPSSFFNHKKVNLSYIKDSLFVVVDCTDMETDIRVDLFMNSRDRMRNNQYLQELESQLEKFLGEEPTLNELNRKRQQERIKRAIDDQKPLEDTLRRLVKENPQLATLLPFGIKIPTNLPGMGTGGASTSVFEGKRTPTFFRFKGNEDSISRVIPVNQNSRIGFETDVADDYFSRKSIPGDLDIKTFDSLGNQITVDYRVGNLRNGVMSIVLDVNQRIRQVGEVLTYIFTVKDDSLLNPFVNTLSLKIIAEAESNSHGGTGHDSASNSGKGNNGGTKSAGLPNIAPVEEKDWERENFTAETSLKIKSSPDGPGYDFFYNKDNTHLKYAQSLGAQAPQLLDHQYKIGLMLFSLALVAACKKPKDPDRDQFLSEEVDVEGLISEITEAISPYWLSIIEALAGLKLDQHVHPD